MSFLNIFFGTSQSKYASIAIFTAIVAICISILLSSTDISIGQRFIIVFFILIASVPSILLTLFELTCIVTGGTKKLNWWCYWFAWFIAAILIVYSVIVIISTFISMFTYKNAMSRITETENKKIISKDDANTYAKKVVESYENINEKKEKELNQPTINVPVVDTKPPVVDTKPPVANTNPANSYPAELSYSKQEMTPYFTTPKTAFIPQKTANFPIANIENFKIEGESSTPLPLSFYTNENLSPIPK